MSFKTDINCLHPTASPTVDTKVSFKNNTTFIIVDVVRT